MVDSVLRFVRVEAPTTVAEGESELSEISLSPNPARDEAMLHLPEGMAAEVVLYGVDGREIWRKEMRNTSNAIKLQGLPSGLYLLKVDTMKGVVWRRLVKR